MAEAAAEKSRSRTACQLGSIVAFALIAAAVALGLTDTLDAAARGAINSMATPALTSLAFGLSFIGSTEVLLLIMGAAALALLVRQRPKQALMLSVVFLASVLANSLVKATFVRPRPEVLFGVAPDTYSFTYSFASGHALMSACAFGLLAGLAASLLGSDRARAAVWALAILLIAAIGWSRIYLGVHHLSDVLAGFALGAFILCTGRALMAKQE